MEGDPPMKRMRASAMKAKEVMTAPLAPLHVAVTWGRPEVADYLLSRGAFFAAKDADGLTPREAAHRRQSLLESGDPAYVARCVEKGMDIPGLREGGKALCKLLDGVAAAGSYAKYTAARQ